MKLRSAINRLNGAQNNIQNGISFLEVQDGILEAAGRIVDRMAELKGMSQDMMKNSFDNATYDNEFRDLQVQLYDMTQQTFNGVTLFAQFTETGGSAVFHAIPTTSSKNFDNTISIYVQFGWEFRSQGEPKQVAYAVRTDDQSSTLSSSIFASGNKDNSAVAGAANTVFSFASSDLSGTMTLDKVSFKVFNKALGEHSVPAGSERRNHVQAELRIGQRDQAIVQHGSRLRADRGRRHRCGKHPFGEIQHPRPGLRGHGRPSQLNPGRSPHAAQIEKKQTDRPLNERGPATP